MVVYVRVSGGVCESEWWCMCERVVVYVRASGGVCESEWWCM